MEFKLNFRFILIANSTGAVKLRNLNCKNDFSTTKELISNDWAIHPTLINLKIQCMLVVLDPDVF